MNMSGDIRVRTDKKYRDIYNDLKNLAVGDMHELFFICVCLGYKANKIKPLVSNGEERFWSRTITPEEYACYYAMVLEKNNMDLSSTRDDKLVIAEMEKYANSGMEILFEDFLNEYCSAEYKLNGAYSKELPRTLLHFIYERLQQQT